MKTHRIALDHADHYQIDFYDAHKAQQAYGSLTADMEAYFSTRQAKVSGSVGLSRYQKYSATGDSQYMYMAQIEDTFLIL